MGDECVLVGKHVVTIVIIAVEINIDMGSANANEDVLNEHPCVRTVRDKASEMPVVHAEW